MKAKTVKDTLFEIGAGGAGYAVWGGGWGRNFGNPSIGRGFYGRGFGFGSSNRGGGPNLMYTYDVKPLNKTLEPPPTETTYEEPIHVGSVIKGKVLGKNKHVISQVLRVEEDEDNNVKYYEVLDPDTSTKIKIDPTSAFIWEPEPEGTDFRGEEIGKAPMPSSVKNPANEAFVPSLENFEKN